MDDSVHDNQDVFRLLELLNLLPPFRYPQNSEFNDAFWNDLAKSHPGKGWSAGYFKSRLTDYRETVRNRGATWEDVRDLCKYCLMYFDTSVPEMCELLNRISNEFSSATKNNLGRRWLTEVADVSWRLWSKIEAGHARP